MPTLEERVQKLEDEAAIRQLVAAYADAGTRNRIAEIAALWQTDGVMTIGEPLLNVSNGVEEIITYLQKLRGDKEFFVQLVNSGVVTVDGDKARAQWIIEEAGKGGEQYYRNYCIASDRYERVEGNWLFAERYFHFVHLDFSPFTGESVRLPAKMESI